MTDPDPSPAPARADAPVYDITVRGEVTRRLLDAFTPMVVSTIAGLTTLHGPVEDQAALDGLLAKIRGFGLELDEVRHSRFKPPGL